MSDFELTIEQRGDRVVQENLACVKLGYGNMKEIPPEVMA